MLQVRPNGTHNGKALIAPVAVPAKAGIVVRDKSAPPLREAEKAALYWVGTFSHMHSEAPQYIPVLFKLVDCPLRGDDRQPVRRRNGQPKIARYVWEIAVQRIGRRSKWSFILWGIDDFSLRIKKCRTLRDAMAIYEQPPSYVLELKAPGVRLRKDRVPDPRA